MLVYLNRTLTILLKQDHYLKDHLTNYLAHIWKRSIFLRFLNLDKTLTNLLLS